jgi:hypothetical protein
MRFFGFKWFGHTRLLINVLEYFDFGFDCVEIFDFSCIPHILSIGASSFCIFSICEQIYSALFSVYIQIHSAYSEKTPK